MLKCEEFAISYGLKFNPSKSQLKRFGRCKSSLCNVSFVFCGEVLPFSDSVTHLGNILRYNLSDGDDIVNKSRELVRKANCLLRTFCGIDPVVLTRLFHVFCLSLYGCALWSLSCKDCRIIEVAFNNILRRIWSLPARTHTGILHSVACLHSILNVVLARSHTLLQAALRCPSPTVQTVFSDSASLCYTFCGFNKLFGYRYCKIYNDNDHIRADVIRNLLMFGGSADVIDLIACS